MQISTFFNSVSFIDKLMFTKHLSIMIKAGVPIFESLQTLSDNTKSIYLKNTFVKISEDIQNGQSLHAALAKYPGVFDNFYVNLIKVSEQSGTLEETLKYLSEQLSKEYALRKKIQGAMFYPVLVFMIALIIGGFISLFVLPKLADLFLNMDIQLPMATRILLNFAGLMKNYGYFIFSAIIALLILGRWAITTKQIKPIWQQIVMLTPIFGKLLIYGQISRLSRNLGTLMKSGVPIAHGLEISADTLNIVVFREHLNVIKEELVSGKNISDSLENNHFREFPGMVTKMIRVGEKTGNLEEVLLYLSDFYEEEIDDLTKNITNVLEPVLLVFIGLIVAFLALAIIGPIFEITGNIS